MTEIATIDRFGRWGTSVFSENTAIFTDFYVCVFLFVFFFFFFFFFFCCFVLFFVVVVFFFLSMPHLTYAVVTLNITT